VDDALVQRGGDALLNVSVETSLYGFIPIYNVYSFTCTTVRGIAVKFE
jgi:bacteriorhodopsin